MRQAVLKQFTKDAPKQEHNERYTVNITKKNARKIAKLKLVLSKLAQYYIDLNTHDALKKQWPDDERLESNEERKVTSISIRYDQLGKLEGVNVTLMINQILEDI